MRVKMISAGAPLRILKPVDLTLPFCIWNPSRYVYNQDVKSLFIYATHTCMINDSLMMVPAPFYGRDTFRLYVGVR